MKKRIKRIALLALALLAVFLLRDRVKKEKAETSADAAPVQTEEAENASSMSVLCVDSGVTLGSTAENPAGEGIVVTAAREDGTVASYTFEDVAVDSWYANAVNFVVSAGLMTGVAEEDLFQPEFGILRESYAAILYRFTNGKPVEPRYHYEDVVEGKWYYDAVSWVSNERLMTGTGSAFGIGEYMTCEQALIGLYRMAGEPETDGSLTDYPYAPKVSDAGRNAVDWAWQNGLITEVECVWYPPQAISRAQVALLLMRYSSMAL